MKRSKILVTALAVALVAVTGGSAYAASPAVRDTVGSIFADIQTYAEGEMPAIPDDAVMFNKEVISEGEISTTLNTYAEDEMPAIPEGARPLNKTVVGE